MSGFTDLQERAGVNTEHGDEEDQIYIIYQ